MKNIEVIEDDLFHVHVLSDAMIWKSFFVDFWVM